MVGNYRDAVFKLNEVAAEPSDQVGNTGNFDSARGLVAAAEPDLAVQSRATAVPGTDTVRTLLVLAAESAFELRDGAKDNMFLAQLREQSESLAQTLAALPAVHQGVDCSLMVRRAQRSVAILDETIHREVLDQIDESTSMAELEATLQVIKATAVEAGKALALLAVKDSGIR